MVSFPRYGWTIRRKIEKNIGGFYREWSRQGQDSECDQVKRIEHLMKQIDEASNNNDNNNNVYFS